MRIFVFPVSGGAFPVQLGLLAELTANQNIIPDLALGSSGGNVAAYICHACQWKGSGSTMTEIVKPINSEMFVTSWWPKGLRFMPSWMIGYFKGSVYSSGTGATELFQKMFTKESICSTEIWTGTLNKVTGKGQFFCNRRQADSILKPSRDDTYASLFSRDCMPLTYMNADIELISKVTIASASIPVLVPEQIINNQVYVDGGTLFASPLTALQDSILEAIDQQNQTKIVHPPSNIPLCSNVCQSNNECNSQTSVECNREIFHIDYFSSFDMQVNSTSAGRGTLYDNSTLAVGELIKSMCIQDRLAAIELLRTPGYVTFYAEMDGTQENLKKVQAIRTISPKTLLEMYPSKNNSINLLSFTGQDIINLMSETQKSYKLRFWWIAKEGDEFKDISYRKLNLSRHRGFE